MMQVAGELRGLGLPWGRDEAAGPDVKEAGWNLGWFHRMSTAAFEKGLPKKIKVKYTAWQVRR